MKKVVMFCMVVFVMVMLTGCAHNMVTYSDGFGFVTTINPETYSFGIDFHYGKILQATVKDNSEVKLSANGKVDTSSNASVSQGISASAPAELIFRTGNQITGYEVELVKLLSGNPEAMKAWLEVRQSMELKKAKDEVSK